MESADKSGSIAIIPLIGSRQTEESRWLGAMFSKLLAEHLTAAGLPVLSYDAVAAALAQDKLQLPLSEVGAEALRRALRLKTMVQGRFVVDDDSKMLGLRLLIEQMDAPRVPIEISSPIAGFAAFIERVALALCEQLGLVVDETVRRKISAVPRPAKYEAFRQFALGVMSWARGQNQLALASVATALELDPDLEEAAAVQSAIARVAQDVTTTRDAFRRWAGIANKRRRPADAAERLLMLGHWLMERGDWSEARRAYEDAREIFQTASDEIGKARVSNNLANLDMLAGKVQNAIQTYRRSLRTFEADPSAQPDTAVTYYNLAVAHKSLGQFDESGTAIERALNLARGQKDTRLEALCLAQRGALRDDLGEWGKASADYAQGLKLLEEKGSPQAVALIKSHQGILHKQQGHYDQAEALMLEAADRFDADGNSHEQAVIWFNLADLYMALGSYDQAWEYANKSLEVFAALKSGWSSRARQLIQMLEQMPREETSAVEEASEAGETDEEGEAAPGDLSPSVGDSPPDPLFPREPPESKDL